MLLILNYLGGGKAPLKAVFPTAARVLPTAERSGVNMEINCNIFVYCLAFLAAMLRVSESHIACLNDRAWATSHKFTSAKVRIIFKTPKIMLVFFRLEDFVFCF